jgi:hypothetical protein
MTDDDLSGMDEGTPPWETVPWAAGDPVLREIAGWAHAGCEGMGITLWTPGGVISGQLIGYIEYLRMMAGLQPDHELGATIAERFNAQADRLERIEEERRDTGGPIPDPTHIHLKRPRILEADRVIEYEGAPTVWRGRISMITGWWLGKVERLPGD